MISNDKKLIMRKVINCFENGRIATDYSSIYIYKDGPNSRRQITLGFGITEYGNLKRLLQVYINENGQFASSFTKYMDRVGKLSSPLVNDKVFIALLVKASKEDAVFRACEDKVFEEKYWAPALKFFTENGFKYNLSMMVLLDSYIHSGSIPSFLRSRFPAKTPAAGGDEQDWISQYVAARHSWLANHSRSILRGTIYRTQFFKNQMTAKNWNLDVPLNAHGIKILS